MSDKIVKVEKKLLDADGKPVETALERVERETAAEQTAERKTMIEQMALAMQTLKRSHGWVLFAWDNDTDGLMCAVSLPHPFTEHAFDAQREMRKIVALAKGWDNETELKNMQERKAGDIN